MKVLKGLTTIVFALVAIFIILAVVGMSKAVNKGQNESKAVAPYWSQIYVGESEADVKSILGKPSDVYTSTSDNFQGGTDTFDSWTYGVLGDTTYSLDFMNGTLQSKSKL